MSGVAWLGSLLLFPLAGAPLLLHPAYRRLPLASRAVLSGAAGAVLASFVMTAEAVLGLRWNVPVVLVSAGILAAAIRPALGAAPSEAGPPPGRVGAATAAAWTLALVTVAAVLWIAATGGASSPDLVFFWGAKAQRFASARTVDLELLRNPFHMFIHPYYPPLVTNVYALASMVAGRLVWMAAVLTFPLLLGGLALGLPGILRGRLGAVAAAAYSALAVAAIGYAGTESDVGGNGEMPLILFESFAIALLVSADAGRPAFRMLAGILLAGVASSKVEGLPFVVAASAMVLARERAGARLSAAARLLAPTALSLGAWFLFGATRRVFFGYSGQGRLFNLHPEYAGIVLVAIGRTLWSSGHALPWVVPLAVLVYARAAGQRSPDSLLPLGTAAALVGFFLFTYVDRAENPALWISWSAARIFMPVAMLLVVAAACGAPPSPSPEAPARPPTAPSPR